MHIVKPLWLKHGGEKKDFEIYSCHVSTDGQRLVTAAGDGYVRIWSTEAIYNGADTSYTKPRQLASLSYHSGTIHSVRFSHNNKYLASGADDKIVCVYVLDPNPPTHTTFGSDEAPAVENWRIYRRLIGHDNDVQDIGWSYDSSILVSVGLDSRIVVWSGYTFEKLKTISQHGSHVKGITFDPANKYFATASDDRTIKVFRYTSPAPNSTAYDVTNSFTLETSITVPFVNSPLTTYFRRCSWSPDGNHIAGANAVNGPVSTAVVIDRGSWECHINLVGHEAPVEVCAFSPRIFSRTPLNPLEVDKDALGKKGDITVIACAGQDRGMSIWNTTSSKPLCIYENLATKSISDLAWSPDGESLFFTSLDGTIALARFGSGELGYPVPLEVNETFLAKYGAGRKVGVVEGPDELVLEEKSKTDELRNVEGRMGELMGDAHGSTSTMPNGFDASLPKNGLTNGITDTPINGQTATNGEGVSSEKTMQEKTNDTRVEKLKQRVTITKDGKKRVAPLLVSSAAGATESSLPRAQLMSINNQTTRSDAPQTILDLSKPYDGLPKGGLATLILGNKRKFAETGAEDDSVIGTRVSVQEREGATPILQNTADGTTIPQPEPVPRPSIMNQSLSISQMRLAVPQIRPQFQRSLGLHKTSETANGTSKDGGNDDSHLLDVRNSVGPSRTGRVQDREPARLTVTRRGQVLWQDFLPKAVSLVTGNERFWAAACEDGSIHTWSPAGRRLLNALLIEAQPVILDCRGPWLLCISAVGMCYVWNMETMSSPHPPISLAPILDVAAHWQGPHLTGGPGIIFARLNSEGCVVIALSNGDAYTYSSSLYVWQRLSEAWWAVGSQYWNTSESESTQTSTNRTADPEENDVVRIENISAGVIPMLERNTTAQTLLRGRAYFLQRLVKSLLTAEGYEGLEAGVSVAHLENRLAAALMLGARDEFKVYLGMYAKRLGAEGARLKIEELLRSLLSGQQETEEGLFGNGIQMKDPRGEVDQLCGWSKDVLLKEVILILGKYRDLQRMTVPYARLLGVTDESNAAEAMVES